MKHLKQLLTQPLNSAPLGAVVTMVVVAFLGFLDAAYLTIEHFMNAIPPCTTGGCETVLTSKYSVILGIPDPLLGSIYYLLILVSLVIYLDSKNKRFLRWTLFFTICGFLFSIWLVYLQAFVIHSYCQYCLGSALTSTILFITACIILSKNAKVSGPELQA